MKYLIWGLLTTMSLSSSCSNKKNDQSTTELKAPIALTKVSFLDSIDHAINIYEQRLDIKMKRKVYEPAPKTLVTIQKWFEFGDTTRLVKLRKEVLTGDMKMEIEQYHFIEGKLTKVHNYTYNKACGAVAGKQCMDEVRYFFDGGNVKLAQKRHAEGTSEHTPVIEQATFESFQPANSWMAEQKDKLARINAKYASLPFPKPRPEQGTPVQPR